MNIDELQLGLSVRIVSGTYQGAYGVITAIDGQNIEIKTSSGQVLNGHASLVEAA